MLDSQSQYYHPETSFLEDILSRFFPESLYTVAVRQSLRCSQALQSDELEGKLKFILVCLKKHSYASSGQLLKAKKESLHTAMLSCNEEVLSTHEMGFFLASLFSNTPESFVRGKLQQAST